jgi:hypothetical protein
MTTLLPWLALSLALTMALPVQAAETEISGEIQFKVASHDATKLADGGVVSRDHLKGTITDSDNASPLNGASHDCFGSILYAPDGEQIVAGHGTCDAIDKDGEAWWLTSTTEASGGSTWTMIGGTGKYEGLSGSGKTTFTMENFNVAGNATPSALLARYQGMADLP